MVGGPCQADSENSRRHDNEAVQARHDFCDRAAIFDHIVRGALFPFPHLKGAGLRNSGPCPSAIFECCTRQHPGHGGHFGKPIQEGVPGLQRCPKAKPPRPTNLIIPSDCHLPAIDSSDGRLRPVSTLQISPRATSSVRPKLRNGCLGCQKSTEPGTTYSKANSEDEE